MSCDWKNCKDLNEEGSSYCYKHNEMIRELIREREQAQEPEQDNLYGMTPDTVWRDE